MKLLDRLRKRERVVLPVAKVEASRVLYESEDRQRVEVRLITEDESHVTLELTIRQTASLASDLASAWRAATEGKNKF